jgi:hypothetical protein
MANLQPIRESDLKSPAESRAAEAVVEDAERHRPRRRRRLLIVSIVSAAIVIAAIVAIADGRLGGNSSSSPSSPVPPPVAVGSGQVTGVLMLNAGLAGGGPLPGTVVLQSDNGKTFWMHVGSDGAFKFQVPPGTYTATGQSPKFIWNDANALCLSHGYVVVHAGETTTTTVVCEGM